MDIAQLKGTDNSQFSKNAEVEIRHPITDEVFTATIKSVKNPELDGDIALLMSEYNKENTKLEKGNLNTEQAKSIKTKIKSLSSRIAHKVTVGFGGLFSEDKPIKCDKDMQADMIDNYDWISEQIVTKASSEYVFYNSKSKTS